MSLSADGNKLWFTIPELLEIASLDLNTFAVGNVIATTFRPHLIREGADRRLYVTSENLLSPSESGALQLDPVTGAILYQVDRPQHPG